MKKDCCLRHKNEVNGLWKEFSFNKVTCFLLIDDHVPYVRYARKLDLCGRKPYSRTWGTLNMQALSLVGGAMVLTLA
jgi:hypothetical protein